MYPLLLSAPLKDYLWGGTRLITQYGFQTDKSIAAEAWVLACHPDGTSIVKNGPCAGQPLNEVLESWGKSALGENGAAFSDFPLLIKLIDARDQLSIQVHPDNAYALKNEGQYGKTEMWYVVDCEPGASLIYGFNRDITQEEFRQQIENNTVTDVANFVPVHKGDVFFIAAGTMHAIGAGILIAEVQQNSNVTYRISDFGRLGADGKPRALHIDQAVDVTNTSCSQQQSFQPESSVSVPGGTIQKLAECEFFKSHILLLDGITELGQPNSFTSVICLDGEAVLESDSGSLSLSRGASVFLPAGIKAQLSGAGQFLCSSV